MTRSRNKKAKTSISWINNNMPQRRHKPLPDFNGHNSFREWRYHVAVLLESYGLSSVVFDEVHGIKTTEFSQALPTKRQKTLRLRKEITAKRIIVENCNDDMLKTIDIARNPKEIWKTFQRQHGSVSWVADPILETSDLCGLGFDGTNLREFLVQFAARIHILSMICSPVPESMFVSLLLQKISPWLEDYVREQRWKISQTTSRQALPTLKGILEQLNEGLEAGPDYDSLPAEPNVNGDELMHEATNESTGDVVPSSFVPGDLDAMQKLRLAAMDAMEKSTASHTPTVLRPTANLQPTKSQTLVEALQGMQLVNTASLQRSRNRPVIHTKEETRTGLTTKRKLREETPKAEKRIKREEVEISVWDVPAENEDTDNTFLSTQARPTCSDRALRLRNIINTSPYHADEDKAAGRAPSQISFPKSKIHINPLMHVENVPGSSSTANSTDLIYPRFVEAASEDYKTGSRPVQSSAATNYFAFPQYSENRMALYDGSPVRNTEGIGSTNRNATFATTHVPSAGFEASPMVGLAELDLHLQKTAHGLARSTCDDSEL